MTESEQNQVDRLFARLHRAPSAERKAILDQFPPDDAVRCEVESLLQEHDRVRNKDSTAALRAPIAAAADQTFDGVGAGAKFGRYTILQSIGEGGFGTVYLARQERPVERRVALKIVKLGMDTKEVLARFEAERQALAMMNHEGIAKVFDGGATESGRPYFVMELVEGIPINEYCDQNRLSVRRRLELFVGVCRAVQHAHQKGIIHRDLKPSNILVTLHEGRPLPRIIDFGVAKAINQRLTQHTLCTQYGQIIGTPAYMSPEQAEMTTLDVDTRADIYSLGAILYELLTGVTPLDEETLRSASPLEMQRMIRDLEPPKPSSRLTKLDDRLPKVAVNRADEPAHLTRMLRGDLDWIAMKCLEKDRTRRYETSNALALDIERYLNDEAVLASPPSTLYRWRKAVRRNKGAFAAAAVITLILIAGLVGTNFALVRALRAERLATREANVRQAVLDFLNEDLLSQASPDFNPVDVTMHEILVQASEAIEAKFTNQPVVEATVRATLARSFYGLGEYELALPHIEESVSLFRSYLGSDHNESFRASHLLALMLQHLGRYEDALWVYEGAINRLMRVRGEIDRLTLNLQSDYSTLLRQMDRLDESEALQRRVLERRETAFGSSDPDTIESKGTLAVVLEERGLIVESAERDIHLREAESLARAALQGRLELHGSSHPRTFTAAHTLSSILVNQGRFASIQVKRAKWEEARDLWIGTVDRARVRLDSRHPIFLKILTSLGTIHFFLEEFESAAPLFEESLELHSDSLGYDAIETYRVARGYARSLVELGRTVDAIDVLSSVYQQIRENPGGSDDRQRQIAALLAEICEDQNMAEEATLWTTRAVDGR